ncbi:MAG: glycosyltransferase [Betaproteobacteria bacterium]
MPSPGYCADRPPSNPFPASRTLFVVDWDAAGARDLQERLSLDLRPAGGSQEAFQPARPSEGKGRSIATRPQAIPSPGQVPWQVLNCPTTSVQAGAAGGGWARVAQAGRYLRTALQAAWRSRQFGQVVVWRQSIGYLLCALPRWPAWLSAQGRRPQLILTTVLLSPSSTAPGSWRRGLLELALRRADGLVYFSREMAQDTVRHRPAWAHKVFWMPLPLFGEPSGHDRPLQAASAGHDADATPDAQPPSVFCGGTSDRDFDVVIEAFRHRPVPVTLVCREDQAFRPPGPIEPHFTVRRGVSEQEYHALAASAGVVVVALKSATSGCGQLLFSFCMRHGVPVIATDCFGTRDEVVHGHSGWLVPAGDAQALGQAYDRLAADPTLRHQLVRNARAQAWSRRDGLAGFVKAMNALGDTLRGAPAPEGATFPQRPQATHARSAGHPIGEAA